MSVLSSIKKNCAFLSGTLIIPLSRVSAQYMLPALWQLKRATSRTFIYNTLLFITIHCSTVLLIVAVNLLLCLTYELYFIEELFLHWKNSMHRMFPLEVLEHSLMHKVNYSISRVHRGLQEKLKIPGLLKN